MIRAEDVMITKPITVTPRRNLLQAREIMRDKKVDSLLVIDKERNLLGYIKLEDIQKIKEKDKLVEEVMNKEPKYVLEDTSLPELLDKFNNLKRGYLPVRDSEGKLLGLITRSSLISVLSSQYIDMEGIIDE